MLVVWVYEPALGDEGQLVTAHWMDDRGIFVTCHEKQKSHFINLKYNQWVINQRSVKPGVYCLFWLYGTDDVKMRGGGGYR